MERKELAALVCILLGKGRDRTRSQISDVGIQNTDRGSGFTPSTISARVTFWGAGSGGGGFAQSTLYTNAKPRHQAEE